MNMSLWISDLACKNTIKRYCLVYYVEKSHVSAVRKISTVDSGKIDDLGEETEIDSLKLFEKLPSRDARLVEFSCAEIVVDSFKIVSLNSDLVKMVLERQWPDFSYLSIDVLSQSSFVAYYELNLDDIKHIGECCKSTYGNVPKELEYFSSLKECADSNEKVLTLAKKVHNMCCPDSK